MVLLLAACGGNRTQTNVSPPVVSLEGRQCEARPNLSTARQVELEARRATVVEVGADTPCWNDNGKTGNAAYAVFALPQAPNPYMVRVSSAPHGNAILMPRVQILNESGAVVREMGRQDMQFRSGALGTVARIQPGQRYLVVSSDPQSVGERNARIVGNTTVTTVPVPFGAIQLYDGHDSVHQLQGSHNGVIAVAAMAMVTAN